MSRVQRGDSCWLWTAAQTLGYGATRNGLAHRVMWSHYNGPIPKKHVVTQICRNRLCVNPAHLVLKSRTDVIARTIQEGKHVSPFKTTDKTKRAELARKAKEAVDASGQRYRITVEDRRKGHTTRGCTIGGRRRSSFDMPKAQRLQLLRDPCVYCGDKATEVDHIVPFSKGGSHDWENRAPTCLPCNRAKNEKSLLSFLLKRRLTTSPAAS